jgi:hypothetical protein
MPTRDIPKLEWRLFLDHFTRRHRGRRIHIDVRNASEMRGKALHEQPLVAVSAIPDCGDGECLTVVAGVDPLPLAYAVAKPLFLRVNEQANGEATSLEIEAEDGSVAVLEVERRCRRDAEALSQELG